MADDAQKNDDQPGGTNPQSDQSSSQQQADPHAGGVTPMTNDDQSPWNTPPGYMPYPGHQIPMPPQPGSEVHPQQMPGYPMYPGYYPPMPPQPGSEGHPQQMPGYPMYPGYYPPMPPQPGSEGHPQQMPGYPMYPGYYPPMPPQPGSEHPQQIPNYPMPPGFPPMPQQQPPQGPAGAQAAGQGQEEESEEDKAPANFQIGAKLPEKLDLELPENNLEFDRDKFVKLLASSISLQKDEKKRIIESMPRLRQEQIDELIRIFEEEKVKFATLSAKHVTQLEKLAAQSYNDWLDIEAEYKQEQNRKNEQAKAEEIRKNLGL